MVTYQSSGTCDCGRFRIEGGWVVPAGWEGDEDAAIAREKRRKKEKEEALARARIHAEIAVALRPLANALRGVAEYLEEKRKAYEESVAWRPLELD